VAAWNRDTPFRRPHREKGTTSSTSQRAVIKTTRSSVDADKPSRRVHTVDVKVTKHSTIPHVRYSFLLCNSNFVFRCTNFLIAYISYMNFKAYRRKKAYCLETDASSMWCSLWWNSPASLVQWQHSDQVVDRSSQQPWYAGDLMLQQPTEQPLLPSARWSNLVSTIKTYPVITSSQVNKRQTLKVHNYV